VKLKDRKGIPYPAKMKFRSWIVAGAPGCGKSYLIQRIGGYPGEVGIDISQDKWWTVEPLTHRPRELHFAFPFKGHRDALPVYDECWNGLQDFPDLDFERIRLPKKKKFILAPDWRARFVFDFILPPPDWLFDNRKQRHDSGDLRLVDLGLTPRWVSWQVHVHWHAAWFFHQAGLQVMLRPFNTARPYSFPVLKKALNKKAVAAEQRVHPGLDWSKVRFAKLWFAQSAPDNLGFPAIGEPADRTRS
jgi:hypothetical protein